MNRWRTDAATQSIIWEGGNDAHVDDVEMSGTKVSVIIKYGRSEKGLVITEKNIFFPTLRLRPNNTHASYSIQKLPHTKLVVNSKALQESFISARFDGVLHITSQSGDIKIVRHFYPSVFNRAAYENIEIYNNGNRDINVAIDTKDFVSKTRGVHGDYVFKGKASRDSLKVSAGTIEKTAIKYYGHVVHEAEPIEDSEQALKDRIDQIDRLTHTCRLACGNDTVDLMYRFAKIRAGESIFDTLGGLMHSPGGQHFYAGIWCNDTLEYAAPWFAISGDEVAIAATLNAFRKYYAFMNEDYVRLPSSIIAEGNDFWDGVGDRGDAAMYLLGGVLFLNLIGKDRYDERLFEALIWCAEYCLTKKNKYGIIESDSDELENRFTSGDANLSTSCLSYGGFYYLSILAKNNGKEEIAEKYAKEAHELATAIDKYFGAKLRGFDTYRYFEGCDELRAWICLPVYFGISGDRTEGTLKALYSPYLMSDLGLRTTEAHETIWDRSLAYTLTATFKNGDCNVAYKKLLDFSEKRLLGERTPYAVEAYPENGMRHLSAESALLIRVITEGMFGLEPAVGGFYLRANVPPQLAKAELTDIKAFGTTINIFVDGEECRITMDGKTITGKRGVSIFVEA